MKKALLGDYITGYSVKNKKDEDIPVYSVTNDRGFCTEYFSKDVSGKDKSKYKIVPRGYFAYNPSRINVGSVDWQNCENRVIVSPLYVVFKTDERLNQEYLKYYLKSDIGKFYINENAVGAVRANLKFDILSKFRLPIPDIEEQKNIVSQLNLIDEMIKLKEKEITVLDTMIKARFVEMFGDPIVNSKKFDTKDLKDVLLLKAGDFTAASEIFGEPNKTNQYPCYGGNGIRGYVSEYNQEGEYSLIGRQGALSGNVQFASGKFKNTEHALLVKPILEMNNIWLNQLLINLDLKRYQTGAAQLGLSVKNLQEIPIIMVCIELQNQFADFVQQVDKSKFEAKSAIEKLKILQKNLLQKYFC